MTNADVERAHRLALITFFWQMPQLIDKGHSISQCRALQTDARHVRRFTPATTPTGALRRRRDSTPVPGVDISRFQRAWRG